MRILADIHGFLVDQAVGLQEDGDAKSGCRQVFRGIVSDHQAFFRFYLCSGQDILIVGRIWLAVVGIFVGCIEFKVFRFQPCPADTGFGGDGREERVGGKNDPETEGTGKFDGFTGFWVITAYFLRLLEFVAVKIFKHRDVVPHLFAELFGKEVPEYFLVGACSWIFHHSGGACPDGVQQRLWFVAERGNACGKRFKVCFYKEFLIHRKKRSVQIEEDCRYHWLCSPFLIHDF